MKEQAAKAWSLIDVSLQRRSELIPNLVEVVKGYAAHESETQQAEAELRAVPAAPATEELPTDATLQGAQDTDRGLKAAAKTTTAKPAATAKAAPKKKAAPKS